MDNPMFTRMPIIITPGSKRQNRTHRKKRINKKWAKRYGFTYYDVLEDGKVITVGRVMYMNQKTYDALHKCLCGK